MAVAFFAGAAFLVTVFLAGAAFLVAVVVAFLAGAAFLTGAAFFAGAAFLAGAMFSFPAADFLGASLTHPLIPLGRVRAPVSAPRLMALLTLLTLDAEEKSIL